MFHKQEASDEILRALIISIALQRIIGGSSLHYIFFYGSQYSTTPVSVGSSVITISVGSRVIT